MTNLESRIIQSLNPDLSADDCALIEHGGQPYLYTTDSLAEGTHFRLDWSTPADIAFKLLHVNLSDLTAAGGEPEFCLLNLGLPEPADEEFITEFASSFRALLSQFPCSLVGGDTFRSRGYLFSLTLSGPALYPRFRRASQNDGLFLSGHVGMSRLGYDLLEESGRPADLEMNPEWRNPEQMAASPMQLAKLNERKHEMPEENRLEVAALRRHLRPEANLQAARQLNALQSQAFPISGAMDLSDGIFIDCQRFAESSGHNLDVNLENLPMLPPVSSRGPNYAAASGEELELLVSSPSDLPDDFARIGEFGESTDAPRARFFLNGKEVVSDPGFEHFRASRD